MAQRRHDPKTRSLVQLSNAESDSDPDDPVKNKDPNRHYVLVSTSGDDVDHYLDAGYVVELHRKDGPHFVGGYKPQQAESEMRKAGCVLMSVELSRKQDIDQYGIHGRTGYQLIHRLQQQVVSPTGMDNPMRNTPARYGRFQNETSAEASGFGSE